MKTSKLISLSVLFLLCFGFAGWHNPRIRPGKARGGQSGKGSGTVHAGAQRGRMAEGRS